MQVLTRRRTVAAMTAATRDAQPDGAQAPGSSPDLRMPPRAIDRGRRKGRRFHLPVAAVLVLGFGGLMLVAVASVLLLGLITTGRNTADLMTDKAQLLMDGLETRVRSQLDPARAQVEFLARSIIEGQIDITDEQELSRHLRTALAAGPQLTGVGFLSTQGDFILVTRTGPADLKLEVERNVFWGPETLELGQAIGGPVWIDPIWASDLGTSVLTVQMPVRRDGRFLGMLLTGVSFTDLSRFLARVKEETRLDAAILFDETYVLAHPILRDRRFDFSAIDERERPPLPTLDELGDPIIAGIWQQTDPAGLSTDYGGQRPGVTVEVRINPVGSDLDLAFRESEVDGREYIYLLKHVLDYGEHPWTLAIAFPRDEVDAEFARMTKLAGVGLVILFVSVLLALWLGRRISRQIKRLATAAVAVRGLDFRSVPVLPDSTFREMSEAANAFNTMVAGLRWFETYVPKALVLRLIDREASPDGVVSEEREVTVMFTDIKGFSGLAQALSPQQTADWLNAHFSLIAGCIEAEGGTVDKFIGDAVMAFWGAPDHQSDHAQRAVRAARAIDRQIRAAAAEATAAGLPQLCLRIGIHSGPVVVGNIGASSRINYTIVGDTVNTAARLEAMGSEMIGDDCCVILAGSDTIDAAGECAGLTEFLGSFQLRGRSGVIDVYRLISSAPFS